MLHFFKSKTRIKNDSFEKGYNTGKSQASQTWETRHNIFKKNSSQLLDEKDKQILSLKEHVNEIEKTMEMFTRLFAKAGHIAIRIEEEQEIKIQHASEEFQHMMKFSSDLLSIKRQYNKIIPEFQKKLNNFKKESLQ